MAVFDRLLRAAESGERAGRSGTNRETLARTLSAVSLLASSEDAAAGAVEALLLLGQGSWAALIETNRGQYATIAVAGQEVGFTFGTVPNDPVWTAALDGQVQIVTDPHQLTPDGNLVIGNRLWRTAVLLPVPGDQARVLMTGRSTADEGWANQVVRLAREELLPAVSVALQRERRMRALEAAAEIDVLTGVANARAWDRRLPVELARASRLGAPVTVVALVPRELTESSIAENTAERVAFANFAARVVGVLREGDLVARTAPTRLMVALGSCDHEQARAVATRIRAFVPAHWSCAIAGTTWNGMHSAGELLQRVEHALYVAQSASDGQPVIFSA